MKILILSNIDSGLYHFRRELLETLVKEHEVFFCVPDGDYIDKIKSIGCQFLPCSLLDRHGTNPIVELKLIWLYKKILKSIQPDIVFTYTIKPNVYGGMACASLNIPYVANITGLGTAVESGGALQKITLSLYRIGLRKAQMVFFQNTDNRDFMIARKVLTGPYSILPGSGVNLEHYSVFPYPHSNIIEFAFIARIMKEKGIDQYLEAAEYIHTKYSQTRFHVCGACEDITYLNRLKELNQRRIIIYHGRVSDMTKIYKMISCTVHPTYYPEGLSNVLLESAASGRPIITTDRSGCREVVEDGVNGFVVEQRNSKDLIKKIEKFLQLSYQERKSMGLAGRAKVEKDFDRKIVIQKYLNEIKKVIQ